MNGVWSLGINEDMEKMIGQEDSMLITSWRTRYRTLTIYTESESGHVQSSHNNRE